ncbi:thiamine/thiamine pyrophosphate ABC transporter permease ThiP [[Haemophilus] ducreyi]|uniref:thiamine/thiamine pyrophosphate ABC transporter permease ThiP n=1 Tax=Haemophilus ducreyi TaxID=730 RepID=UPI0007CDE88D|nr:thiamine/thiamine pyrophosphate ABC transporter permease ThiP [[Haemophilus] ducreyi]ANF68282.1 thiamine/thiamine pyrophosphate ABC transporter permease ThiP [[Haemophilus] ducreyi]ANF69164.1 thiamine/thiamine pyrophosphate ABC transporter permease ThiP [[Haemophilus] ducreyi]
MLRSLTKFSAWLVYLGIVLLYLFSLFALLNHRQGESDWQWSEMWPILKYSLLQAGLSAGLATIFAVLLARSFFYLQFKGKTLLYKVISFVWALPSLVVIFAIIGVWGNAGWLAQFANLLGLEWQFSLYGLQGILLAHLLFNVPLVTKYCLEGLRLIPSSQHKLAAQLTLRGWAYFRIVEWPTLSGILPYSFANVFLICFTSFPIVLMLGGSPKYSTLEVAIYQAVTFEFDFAKATMLIITQLFVGMLLQLMMDLASKTAFKHKKQTPPAVDHIWLPKVMGKAKYGLQAVLFLQSLAIILPLISVIISALQVSNFWQRLANDALWQATWFSLWLSLIAASTVVALAYLLALETRQQSYRQQKMGYSILSGVVNYPLVLPIFLLAVGLFLLLMEVDLSTTQLLWLVGICNGLSLLPYIYRLLFATTWQVFVAQDQLARNLGLCGLRRWWIVEKHYLIRPLINAFCLAMSASLGSFAVIAFFGSPDFSSLPYLLYQQLGNYRTEDAAVTALVLMLFALLPFLLIKQQESLK